MPLQWLGSGQARPVATAQLKLLVSFTPIPGPREGVTQPQALQQGLHAECRRSSSSGSDSSRDEALSSVEGSSGQEAENTEAADSRASFLRPTLQTLEHQPWRREARGSEAGRKRSAPHKHADRQPLAKQLGRSPAAMAPFPKNAHSVISAAQTGQGSGQGRAEAHMQDPSERPRTPALTPNQALSRLIERAEQLREVIEAAAADGWAPDQPSASSGGAHALQAAQELAHDCAQSRESSTAVEGPSGGSAEAFKSLTGEPSARGHGRQHAPAALYSRARPAGDALFLSDARDNSSGNAKATTLGRARAGQSPVMSSDGHAAVTPGEASGRVAKRSRLSRLATGSMYRPAARHFSADSSQPRVGCSPADIYRGQVWLRRHACEQMLVLMLYGRQVITL